MNKLYLNVGGHQAYANQLNVIQEFVHQFPSLAQSVNQRLSK